MPNKNQHKGPIPTDQHQEIEIQYILDNESLETAKKLEKKTFDKLLKKDLEIIKKHRIKKTNK